MSNTSGRAPRTKPAAVRREELLSAAQQLFLERGVDATTVDDITSRAGVAKGTFYLHFASKEALIEAMRERFAQQMRAAIESAVSRVDAQDFPGKLGAWVRASVAGYLESMRLHNLLFYAARPAHSEGMTDNPLIDHLLALLLAGSHARAWRLQEPRNTAVFLFNGLHGLIEAAARGGGGARRLLPQAERLVFRAVGLAP